MRKTICIGKRPDVGYVFCKIEVEEPGNQRRLSISGVEGPKSNGDALGSCGQITLERDDAWTFEPGWDAITLKRFVEVWDRWHLNDMRAGCEHQRRTLDTSTMVEVVSYGLTHEAMDIRRATRAAAANAALAGTTFAPSPTARALAEMEDWFKDQHEPPDADSPLTGMYEIKKRKTERVCWVYPHEHPQGLLGKICAICGYKYGSAWLYEEVPANVIAWLFALPDAGRIPAWV